MKNSDKIILDLCGGTGSWSKPYKGAGYDVYLATLPDYDIRDWRNSWILELVSSGKVYGIIAAPPCTMFSFARTNAQKPRDFKEGMECVRACLDIIWSCMEVQQATGKKTIPLKFWALENPARGFLKNFLGKPAFTFDPWEFGDGYQKHTALWGNFNQHLERKYAKAEDWVKFDYMKSKDIHPERFGELTRQERRSITPAGFAKAFFEANQ